MTAAAPPRNKPQPAPQALAILALAAALTVCGCTFAPQRYSQPEVRTSALQPGDLARDGLAILTPSTVTGQEEDRQTLALLFTGALTRARPELRVSQLPEVLSSVNRAGLAEAYQHLYQGYRLTGVFHREELARISSITGARYLGQLKLARFDQGARGRFGLFGLSLLQTQYAHMRVFFQIWDAQSGAVVWEGIDELTVSVETSRERAVTLRALAEASAQDLAERLP
ncbi:MAG: hypothetical protein WCJ69_13820 [Betaproteobacteria bacterium]|jgi:hypothetical protein